MGKIKSSYDLTNIKDQAAFQRFGSTVISEIGGIINGGVDFVDNIRVSVVSAVFGTANEDLPVAHTLGRLPIGYIVIGSSVAMDVYDGAQASTSSTIYLRSNAVGTAKVMVI